ncbi:hypothetical protein [Neorhizobium galegae]|uniref:Uncharacterized protein n=1 Tax=Neorhizobium galegae bv. officinalis TaxID=323656 RepID=A0A0T7GMM4_NEOGA|nr:hypothetical protein [Neorhizobium galegae]CDZ48551.1 Hypothetical protein NGAL_HAMBI1189_25170 [Neorhizobium galegae bv. officinalis]
MLAALALSASIGGAVPAADGDFIPGVKDFRSQQIHRVRGEKEWPFMADRGTLLCAPSWKNQLVYFVPQDAEGKREYPFALSDNVMLMAMVNMGRKSVLQPYDSFEQLLQRLFPYIAMGKRLCDQPAGATLPDSSL